jgi:NADH-quinone oxidoreductase subunit H
MQNTMILTIFIIIKILILIVPLLISVAYFTLAERKILGAIQRRRGPNVIGVFGLLQPLADGLKLFVKESVLPSTSDAFIFYVSPLISFVISLMGWAVIPYGKYSVLSEISLGVLYLFGVSSLGVYGIIMSGWSSNSKYAFLGALRSTAQMVSYEVSIGFILVIVVACVGSFNLQLIIEAQKNIWFFVPFFPLFLLFFISSLAETNRHPFDLPEAEAELVSGYNVEYSAMSFALFSLSEYSNMLLISALNIILFFGGWLPPLSMLIDLTDNFLFWGSLHMLWCTILLPWSDDEEQNLIKSYSYSLIGALWILLTLLNLSQLISLTNYSVGNKWFGLKIIAFVILFVWMRAALPRYRYDQLMGLGWKTFLPFSLTYLIFIICYLFVFNMLPY